MVAAPWLMLAHILAGIMGVCQHWNTYITEQMRQYCSIGVDFVSPYSPNYASSEPLQSVGVTGQIRLGSLLRELIDKSGYSINRLAGEARVDRTSLTHVCNNRRMPSSEMVEAVLPLLKITPQERAEFYDLWERAKLGDGVWSNRRAFRKMVERSAAFVHAEEIPESSPRYIRVNKTDEADVSHRPLSGFFRGSNLLMRMMLDQILTEAERPNPHIAIMMPVSSHLFETFLGYLFDLEPHILSKVDLRLLVPMSRVASIFEQAEAAQLNIQSLAALLPAFVRYSQQISVAYYYLDEPMRGEHAAGPDQLFPYYLLTSQSVTLISTSPQPVCYTVADTELVDHVWYRFESSWNAALPLFEKSIDLGHMVGRLNETAVAETASWTIELQPCVIMSLTDEQIEHYCRQGLPHREQLVGIMQMRCRALRQQQGHVSIFSREGAERFMRDGILSDIPQGASHPIEPADRIRLIRGAIDAAKSGRMRLHMVNPAVFVVPGRTSVVISDLPDLTIVTVNADGSFTYAHVMEPSLRAVAVDFASSLTASPYVSTCDEAISFLEGLVAAAE